MSDQSASRHQVLVVGGGAGGLELATRLGRRLSRREALDVTLVDDKLTHLWKPLLHEVAAGTLDSFADDIDYLSQGRYGRFRFRLGRMDGLDRQAREITIAPSLDAQGREYIARRTLRYDTLVLAVGSETNDFGTPGVAEHCAFLDNRAEADAFHQRFVRACLEAHAQDQPLRPGQLHVAIVGAGATGIELAAELHHATRRLVAYGLDRIHPDRDVRITILEAAPQILPALPERLAETTLEALAELGIEVRTGVRIVRATAEGFETETGEQLAAEIKVWAAGVKAPDFLRHLDGLETHRRNQLLVTPTLATTRDPDVFAIGDCAACPSGDGFVPPRAQAAHQQANHMYKVVRRRLRSAAPPVYRYVDYGSLINMSRYSTVGSLMGNLLGRVGVKMTVEGVLARLVYRSLYTMHQVALFGYLRVAMVGLADLLTRGSRRRLKLH